MHKFRSYTYNLLRKSERYTKTDMVYLVRGGFWLTSGQVIALISSFLLSIAFANLIPKETYGIYRYVLSAASIIGAFSLTGLSTAIVQSVARGYEGALRSSFRLSLRWSSFAVIAALAGAGYYFYQGNNILGTSLIIIGACSPLLNSAGLFASYINGKKDFKRLSFYSLVDNIVPSLALLTTLVFTKNVLILVAVFFASSTLMATLLYLRTLKVFAPNNNKDPEIESYSKRLSLLNIVGIITTHIDKVLIFTTLGAIELAIYGFAIVFPEQIRSMLKNISTLMIPKFAEKDEAKSLGLKRKTLQLTLLLVAIIVAYVIAAPYLYQLFFPAYPESIFYSRIFAISIFSALAMIPTSVLIAQKKEKELSKVSIIGSLIQIGILFPAIHMWGLLGAIIAKTLAAYINLGIAYYMMRHR